METDTFLYIYCLLQKKKKKTVSGIKAATQTTSLPCLEETQREI